MQLNEASGESARKESVEIGLRHSNNALAPSPLCVWGMCPEETCHNMPEKHEFSIKDRPNACSALCPAAIGIIFDVETPVP